MLVRYEQLDRTLGFVEREAAGNLPRHRRDRDPGQLVLEQEAAVGPDAGAEELGAADRAARAERVQVADVRLVLEDELEPERLGFERDRLGAASREALQLDEPLPDEPHAPVWERVDEGAAHPERLLLDHAERPAELFVADEHVAVHVVARAAADRVVRVVAQEVTPGEAHVGVGEGLPGAEGAERRHGLGGEQPALGALVGLLYVHARGVDSAEDVLETAADELSLVAGEPLP